MLMPTFLTSGQVQAAGFCFDLERPFLPEDLTPLFHSPLYSELRNEERLRYNQLCGVMAIDQFLHFEHDVLLITYERPLRSRRIRHPQLRRQVARLVADEHRHRRVFAEVRQALLPGPGLVRPGPLLRGLERLMGSELLDLRFWLWFGFAIEESGCHLAERIASGGDTALGPVDGGMAALLAWHRSEELHHLGVDERAIATCWDSRPAWRRRLDAILLDRLLWAMRRPALGGRAVVRRLVAEHPRLAPRRRELEAEVLAVRGTPAYQRWFAGPVSCPRWSAALAARPEMAPLAARQLHWTGAAS